MKGGSDDGLLGCLFYAKFHGRISTLINLFHREQYDAYGF
jgi:hypothetical protein